MYGSQVGPKKCERSVLDPSVALLERTQDFYSKNYAPVAAREGLDLVITLLVLRLHSSSDSPASLTIGNAGALASS